MHRIQAKCYVRMHGCRVTNSALPCSIRPLRPLSLQSRALRHGGQLHPSIEHTAIARAPKCTQHTHLSVQVLQVLLQDLVILTQTGIAILNRAHLLPQVWRNIAMRGLGVRH